MTATTHTRPRAGAHDPAVAVGLLLAGSLLSFYVIGLPLIAAGAWMWARRREPGAS